MLVHVPGGDGVGALHDLDHVGGTHGAAVPQRDHAAGLDAAGGDGLVALGVGVEHPGPAPEAVHTGLDGGGPDHGAVPGQGAPENGQTAFRADGMVHIPDHVVDRDG